LIHKGFDQLKATAKTHFKRLYKEEGSGYEEVISNFLSHIPSLVSRNDNLVLVKPFS
jgi:hypothetical protein